MGSFGTVCRLCCEEENELIGIYNSIGYQHDFAGKIKKYLSIEVLEADLLPHSLCQECVANLGKFDEFARKSQQAQEMLNEIHLETVLAMKIAKEASQDDGVNHVQSLLLQEHLYRNPNYDQMKSIIKPKKARRKSTLPVKVTSYPETEDSFDNITQDVFCETQSANLTDCDVAAPLPHNVSLNMTQDGEKICRLRGDHEKEAGEDVGTEDPAALNNCRISEPIVKLELFGEEQPPAETAITPAIGKAISSPWTHIARCGICLQPFLALSSLLLHHRMSHGNDPKPDSPLLCVFCPRTFTHLNKLMEHVEEEHAGQTVDQDEVTSIRKKKNHQCKECLKVLPTLRGLKIHMRAHTRRRTKQRTLRPIKKRKMAEPDDNFSDLSNNDMDYTSENVTCDEPEVTPPPKNLTNEGKYQCKECNKLLPSLRGLKIHMRRLHIRERRLPKKARPVGRPRSKTSGDTHETVRCALCKVVISDVSLFRGHISSEHPDTDCLTPFGCTRCDKTFSNAASLAHHKLKHKMQNNKCGVCHKSFNPKYLQRHMVEVHTEERPYKCEECGKAFKTAPTLKIHMEMHKPDGEKQVFQCSHCTKTFLKKGVLTTHIKIVHQKLREFECRHCNYAFPNKFAVLNHERIHTGEKPFACQVCDYRGGSKADLKHHMAIHSDEMPFSCNTCGKRTRSKTQMTRHELIHTDIKPYPCKYCGKNFRTSYQRHTHERLHTGEQPYSCAYCPKTFSDLANYHKHEKQVHLKEYEQSQREKNSADNQDNNATTAGFSGNIGSNRIEDPQVSKSPRNKSFVKISSPDKNQKISSSDSHVNSNLSVIRKSSSSTTAPNLHAVLEQHSALNTASLSHLMSATHQQQLHLREGSRQQHNVHNLHLQSTHQSSLQPQSHPLLQQHLQQPSGNIGGNGSITSSLGSGNNSNSSSMYTQQPAHMQHSHLQHIEQPYTPPFPASLNLQNPTQDSYNPSYIHLQRL